jgi:hypothetical protein
MSNFILLSEASEVNFEIEFYEEIPYNFFKLILIKLQILIQLLSHILHNKQAATPLCVPAFGAFYSLEKERGFAPFLPIT